jgi:CheY-like chemotaxis protein
MREMSGLDILRKLNDDGLAQKINIVLVTASPMYPEIDLKQIRADYGVIGRVKKPFTDTELLSVYEKYV